LVLQHCNVCLLGDHDATFLHELAALRPTTDDDRQRANILRSWPLCLDEEHLYLHASPRDPLHEYVFPEDIHNQAKLTSIFARFARHCFAGHTHLPGVFTERREFFTPAALDHRYPLGPQKALINVGSVGQPRDGDPRACYAVLADGLVTFQRVDYPRQRTIEKIGPQPPSDG
jgi:diadenosine tetraphosphatase ApaH/serine/threonine PP2A family protein phosphatase